MNVFEAVKANVTAREAAEMAGIHVKHNGMCCCPFHGDKNPSMKIEKRYHCFACGEDGDVINFAAKLYGLSPKDAALRLADEFHVYYDDWKGRQRGQWHEVRLKPRKSPEQMYREEEHHFFRVVSDYYHVLREWKERYKPLGMEEEWDLRFEEAIGNIGMVEGIMERFLAASREERKEMFGQYQPALQKMTERLQEIDAVEKRSVLPMLKAASLSTDTVSMEAALNSLQKTEKCKPVQQAF